MTIDERIEKLVEHQEKPQVILAGVVDGIQRLERKLEERRGRKKPN